MLHGDIFKLHMFAFIIFRHFKLDIERVLPKSLQVQYPQVVLYVTKISPVVKQHSLIRYFIVSLICLLVKVLFPFFCFSPDTCFPQYCHKFPIPTFKGSIQGLLQFPPQKLLFILNVFEFFVLKFLFTYDLIRKLMLISKFLTSSAEKN